jgi:hypothetical protein
MGEAISNKRGITSQFIRHYFPGKRPLPFEQLPEKPQCGSFISSALNHNINGISILVNCTP